MFFLRHVVEYHNLSATVIDGAVPFRRATCLLLNLSPQMTHEGFTPTPLSGGHRRAVVPVRRVRAPRLHSIAIDEQGSSEGYSVLFEAHIFEGNPSGERHAERGDVVKITVERAFDQRDGRRREGQVFVAAHVLQDVRAADGIYVAL